MNIFIRLNEELTLEQLNGLMNMLKELKVIVELSIKDYKLYLKNLGLMKNVDNVATITSLQEKFDEYGDVYFEEDLIHNFINNVTERNVKR
jgi:hypothetical protein